MKNKLKRTWRIVWISFIAFYLVAFTAQILSASQIIPKAKPTAWLDINDTDIKFYIKMNEDMKFRVYKDSRGYLTAGIGHKITNKRYKLNDIVSSEQIEWWFNGDYNTAKSCAFRFLNNDYNHKELKVATDMAFNLGCRGLNEFKLFRKHINKRDYNMAAKAIRLSNYYSQVKNRADRNIDLLVNQ